MAEKNFAWVEFDMDELKESMKELSVKDIRAQLNALGDFIVTRARANAPIKEGPLRKSLAHDVTLHRNDIAEIELGSTLQGFNYAMRWHEEPFKLGPVSAKEPMTPEGGVQNKYYTRVLEYHRKHWADELTEHMLKAYEKRVKEKRKKKRSKT